jgi:hypothetical protein
MKGGTTTLHAWLDTHPDVCMSPRKELDFFVEDGNWDRGVGWYRLRFRSCGAQLARGESSPNYSKTHLDPDVPERMHSVIPEARLIYVVREPIARMRSMYRHLAMDGGETRSFTDAVTENADYIATSRYIRHIGAFLKDYDTKQLLVITTEHLEADPNAALAEIYTHIGVAPVELSPGAANRNVTADRRIDSTLSLRLKANPGYWRALNRSWRLRAVHDRLFTRAVRVPPADLPPEVEAELRDDLEKDTEALEVFLGRKLTEWGR